MSSRIESGLLELCFATPIVSAPPMLAILAPHFTAGVIVGERAAPIVDYMRSWSPERIRSYCARKGWRVVGVP